MRKPAKRNLAPMIPLECQDTSILLNHDAGTIEVRQDFGFQLTGGCTCCSAPITVSITAEGRLPAPLKDPQSEEAP